MNGKNIRFQHLKIKDQKDSKSEINGKIVGAVDQNKDYAIKTSESEPMKFCPKCNGMMLPSENGDLRCNSCGYGFDGSQRKISKPYYYYNHEPEIRQGTNLTEDQKRIVKILNEFDDQSFDIFCSTLNISNTDNKDEVIDNIFSNRSEIFIDSAIKRTLEKKIEIANENKLKNKLCELDIDVFNQLVTNLRISQSKTKDQQIEDMFGRYYIYQIENEITKAKKDVRIHEKQMKKNHVEKLREDFKEELLGLDSRVLEKLFLQYDLTSPSLDKERKMDILVRHNSFKRLRKDYKKIKLDMGI